MRLMTRDEFRTKWHTETATFRRRHALVDAATLCEELLEDFEAVTVFELEGELNLRQAAIESGYSADHLGMLVRHGKIPNVGRPNAPKIRRRDLPLRPSRARQPRSTEAGYDMTSAKIARAIVYRSR